MVAADEAALRCDFAEVYHVLDYRALPARQAALFACGLPDGSRIVRRLTGASAAQETVLLAAIADAVRILVWQNTRDGMDGRNPPPSILTAITADKKTDGIGFASAEEFDAWRSGMLGGDNSA